MAEDSAQEKPSGQMTDEELLQLIRAYELASLGSSVAAGATISTTVFPSQQTMTTLEIDRYNALNMYFARPLGNEVENRSQIVLPELRDTVEWIMPQLMRIFAASGAEIFRFEPEGPNDVDQAALETSVVNHVFTKMNPGFIILHDFFKDCLLMRNGYVEIYYCEEQESAVERYTGLDQMEVARLLADKDDEKVEVLEQREYTVDIPQPPADPTQLQGQPPGPTSVPVFDLKLRRTKKVGRIKVDCLPPEEMRISPRTRGSLDQSPFVQHKTETTRSELIADGHEADLVNDLPAGRPNWFEMDALARNQVVDQLSLEKPADRAMQEIEVRYNTIRVDVDRDGIAELRSVLVAGDKILDNEEIEECPIASGIAIRMPHRHTGISLYDLLADLQVIKTTLFRQGLDNLYLANQTRIGADWKNVNVDDLMTVRPGGVIRTNGPPQNSLFPIEQPSNLVQQIIPALEYCDSMREMRTGVGRTTMGVDADALADVTKGGQLAAMSAASLKIEMIARMLAETGVTEIARKIHGALMRHQDKPLMFEISGKWQEVDPTCWRRRTRVTSKVGLGSGNREEARANIQLLGTMQANLAQFGLVGPKQAYETFKRGAHILGFESPQLFAMDPSSPEYAQHQQQMAANPPPPAPPVQVAQIRAQSEQAKLQAQNQRDVVQLRKELLTAQGEVQAANARAQAELMHAALEGHHDRAVDLAQTQQQIRADLTETLIKVIGQIVSSQLKQNAQADAGQVLTHDVREAEAGIR